MPIPTPNLNETVGDFIDRCMSDEIMIEDYKDEKQRLAVCNTQLENKKNNNNMEKRIFNVETRVDSTDDGKDVVVGYASVYDSKSNNLGGFYEFVERGVFNEDLINSSDVRSLINHDPNLILARSTSGTLKLSADERG